MTEEDFIVLSTASHILLLEELDTANPPDDMFEKAFSKLLDLGYASIAVKPDYREGVDKWEHSDIATPLGLEKAKESLCSYTEDRLRDDIVSNLLSHVVYTYMGWVNKDKNMSNSDILAMLEKDGCITYVDTGDSYEVYFLPKGIENFFELYDNRNK